jgi:hypothetical protein
VNEAVLNAREEFPDIKDPHETALAEADKVARLLANRGLESGAGYPADDSRPAGEPLVARDAYGSRLLLMAPFSYGGGAPDHWYAWDIDLCWIALVVGSPHRIEMAAHLIREGYFADYANAALRLLPEWTEWCIEQSGLDGGAAARSREAARAATSVLVDDEDDEPVAEDDEAPFRRHE